VETVSTDFFDVKPDICRVLAHLKCLHYCVFKWRFIEHRFAETVVPHRTVSVGVDRGWCY